MKRAEIERLLPEVFQRTAREGGALQALLGAMDDLHAPSEAILEDIAACFDPRRAAPRLVLFLARWVDLERILEPVPHGRGELPGARRPISSGLGRLRELVATAAWLSQWRGTARGLGRFLQTATGHAGFEVDDRVPGSDGRPRPFHLKVRAPAASAPHRPLIERIIDSEKPAYVTAELEFVDHRPRGG